MTAAAFTTTTEPTETTEAHSPNPFADLPIRDLCRTWRQVGAKLEYDATLLDDDDTDGLAAITDAADEQAALILDAIGERVVSSPDEAEAVLALAANVARDTFDGGEQLDRFLGLLGSVAKWVWPMNQQGTDFALAEGLRALSAAEAASGARQGSVAPSVRRQVWKVVSALEPAVADAKLLSQFVFDLVTDTEAFGAAGSQDRLSYLAGDLCARVNAIGDQFATLEELERKLRAAEATLPS